MIKNRNFQIAAGVVLLVILLGGGYFLVAGKSKSTSTDNQTANQDVVLKLSPKDIGLTLTAKPDNKAVKFTIDKASDIKSIEYQLTYEADSTAQERSEGGDARVQRGITGDTKIESGKSLYESPWLDLGSCSKNVCHYDTGVKSVQLTLKVVKNDDKTYAVEQSLDL